MDTCTPAYIKKQAKKKDPAMRGSLCERHARKAAMLFAFDDAAEGPGVDVNLDDWGAAVGIFWRRGR